MSDWTAAWNASPTDSDLVGNGDEAIADTRDTIGDRLVKEHFLSMSEVSPQPQQGRHRPGSAVSYAQATAPTLKPDGSAVLDSIDHGRLWLDTDTNVMYFWKWTTSSGAWTECSPAHGLVLLTSGTSWTATRTGPVKVTCIGGGGGGVLVSTVEGGGGSGAVAQKIIDVVLGTSYAIAIGAGGSSAGADGGDTTFNDGLTTITAGGGKGATASTPADGGAAANGTLNFAGNKGECLNIGYACQGGSPPLGYGKGATAGSSTSRISAAGYGAGGSSSDAATVAGTAGCILIEW